MHGTARSLCGNTHRGLTHCEVWTPPTASMCSRVVKAQRRAKQDERQPRVPGRSTVHRHDSLVLIADARTGGAGLAGGTLELRIITFADSTFALPTTVTLLPVLGEAGGFLQGAVAGAPRVVGVADALPALAASVSCEKAPTTVNTELNTGRTPLRLENVHIPHLHRACCSTGHS